MKFTKWINGGGWNEDRGRLDKNTKTKNQGDDYLVLKINGKHYMIFICIIK